MARHLTSEPRVAAVVRRLARQVLVVGSVKAVADAISAHPDGEGRRVYPNRIHGLLSGDPTRSVTTSTLAAIEAGLEAMEADGPDVPVLDPATIAQAVEAARADPAVDPETAVEAAATRLGLPIAVVAEVTGEQPTAASEPLRAPGRDPDWSWQGEAVHECLRALRSGPAAKVGLVVPTGGGKTRIALLTVLRWLAESSRNDTVVLWVTHRRLLRTQARRTLHALLREHADLPDEAARLLQDRIRFVMIHDLPSTLARADIPVGMVVVDEAHHAAAPTYQSAVDAAVPGLFLTATPNRVDSLPIGIDHIAYTITYRELFARGCVIEPVFDPSLDLDLDWTSPAGLRDLADYLLDRSESDFQKVLVAVSLQERAEVLHDALLDLLDERTDHPLTADEVGFVHGGANSSGLPDPGDFLDDVAAWPKGIVVATSQLIGEGFDDPSIDAVVVTYPSTSIGHLMQVAGRALRWAPGKEGAHVVQVRESALEYHFDQRWLYQDISDELRPDLVDIAYGGQDHLEVEVAELLHRHHVEPRVRRRIEAELEAVSPGEPVQLLLTGVHHFGPAAEFAERAEWGAVLVTPTTRTRFVTLFNDISARSEDVKEHAALLDHVVSRTEEPEVFRSYVDMVEAMEYARREVRGVPHADEGHRSYEQGRSTSWLRYVTFHHRPVVPAALEAFLAQAVNKDAVTTAYLDDRDRWRSAVRVSLPLAGDVAFLLDEDQAAWLGEQRALVVARLSAARPEGGFDVLDSWRRGLSSSPVAALILDQFAQLVRREGFAVQYLELHHLDAPSSRSGR